MIIFYSASFAGPAMEVDRSTPLQCTYETLVWNVYLKSSRAMGKVSHSYADLAPDELDPVTGCTVCSEDQVRISIPPLQPFSLCYKLAPRMRSVIETMIRGGAPIRTIDGYRAVRSRGPIDASGNRTEFSNHSFGTAIDVNQEQNGLFDNCIRFGPDCRLVRGGQWLPGVPGTLEKDGDIVVTLQSAGFRWGGEIAGKQKDFMHFSLTGY